MLRLILAFVDIMLHRRGPDRLPSSQFLLWTLLALSIVADCALLWLAGESARSFAVSLLVTGFDLWFVWAVLRTFNRQPRFRQTMTAILGAELLLAALQAPLVRPLVEAPPPDPQNPMVTLTGVLWLAILVWAIDISAFVFSRALERPYFLCVAIVIAYFLLMRSLQITLLQPVA
ncbi:MAG TPA: hypothetical protein VLI71_08185 [Gammaproteobacteria bacterium]|nr:hypothetical protein [Gammaproteobacteria bacterium]